MSNYYEKPITSIIFYDYWMFYVLMLEFNFIVFLNYRYEGGANLNYTIIMDPEKSSNLYATSDVDHILADSFLFKGQLTDLYLYPTELKILQRSKIQTIPIDFNLTFSIITNNEGPIGIALNIENEKIELARDFWPRGK